MEGPVLPSSSTVPYPTGRNPRDHEDVPTGIHTLLLDHVPGTWDSLSPLPGPMQGSSPALPSRREKVLVCVLVEPKRGQEAAGQRRGIAGNVWNIRMEHAC